MAIFFPLNHDNPGYSKSFGIASDKRHLLNPKRLMISASSSFSINSFSPTTPKSATPVATVCGISSSRRNNTSIGKLEDCTNKVRLVVLNLISDSSKSAIVSSKRRPLACTAILNMILFNYLLLITIRIKGIKKRLTVFGKPLLSLYRVYTISSMPTELFVRKMMMMMCSCIFHISFINCDKSKVFV